MKDLGLLVLRLVSGGLVTAHGLQKLVGAFNGPGPQGTAGFMEAIGLRPGSAWGKVAALSETGAALTVLGAASPLGPIGTAAAMTMAAATVHRGKPIWAGEGGAELPIINLGIALALALTGPGKFSVDALLGTRLPRLFVILAWILAMASIAYALFSRETQPEEPARQTDPFPAPESDTDAEYFPTEIRGAGIDAGTV